MAEPLVESRDFFFCHPVFHATHDLERSDVIDHLIPLVKMSFSGDQMLLKTEMSVCWA